MMTLEPSEIRIIREADEVTDEVLAAVGETLDWFEGQRSLPTEEFIERLCQTSYLDGWELDNYDSPAARKIMRHARKLRAEREG